MAGVVEEVAMAEVVEEDKEEEEEEEEDDEVVSPIDDDAGTNGSLSVMLASRSMENKKGENIHQKSNSNHFQFFSF